MCNVADPAPVATVPIDIWGSCVSRDTMEFIPKARVSKYVARQSAVVSLAPANSISPRHEELESLFQQRMLLGDTKADVVQRIEESDGALIVIDLVDERRGVWQFPDGTFLTNSVEAYRTGVDQWASEYGARLVEFGTDEHFSLWKEGFAIVSRNFVRLGRPVVLLDIAWASVFEGQPAADGTVARVRRVGRRSLSTVKDFARTTGQKRSVIAALGELHDRPLAQGDEYLRAARYANRQYRRYIAEAQRHVSATITRRPEEVRMNKDHRWGIGPYHYSDHDYRMISSELEELIDLNLAL